MIEKNIYTLLKLLIKNIRIKNEFIDKKKKKELKKLNNHRPMVRVRGNSDSKNELMY